MTCVRKEIVARSSRTLNGFLGQHRTITLQLSQNLSIDIITLRLPLGSLWNTAFFFVWAKSLIFGEASQVMSFFVALFASFQLDWATTTGRLLGSFTCLPHEDGGILLIVLPKDITSKLADLCSPLSLLC